MANDFYEIALIGFSPSEFSTFETFFRLVSSRRPKPYRAIKEMPTASLVLVNAVGQFEVAAVTDQLRADQLLMTVGATRSERAWRHLDRPINLNGVLIALDSAFGAASGRPVAAAAPAAAVAAPVSAPSVVATSPPVAAPTPSPRPAPAPPPMVAVPPPMVPPNIGSPVVREMTRPAPIATGNVAPFPAPSRPIPIDSVAATKRVEPPRFAPQSVGNSGTAVSRTRILVVDDSDVALKFIHNRLSAFGFQVDQCTSGEEALVRVSDGDYSFVFLDVMMAGLDGYQTCKAIKGRRYAGGRAPVVVMLTSRGGTIDKVRGTFAGCDAYLTKPLDESKMLKVLLKHDGTLGDSISTLSHPTVMSPLPSASTDSGRLNPLAAAYEGLNNRRS